MFSKKLAILVVLTMIATMVLAACGPTPEPETIIQAVPVEVTKIVEVEGESQNYRRDRGGGSGRRGDRCPGRAGGACS